MNRLFLLTFFLLCFSIGAGAEVYKDRTSQLWPTYQREGVDLQEERMIAGIKVRLFLSNTAKQAIEKKAFLQPDPNYNQANLNQFILSSFSSSLDYFGQLHLVQAHDVPELNLVIVDRGGDRGSISEVPVHSRIIELHLVRWHKSMLKNQPHYVNLSSIHEFAHVVNYMYSPGETKYHRELGSVFVEGLNLVKLYGVDYYLNNYRRLFAGTITNPELIQSDAYNGMPILRHLAYRLFANLLNNVYKSTGDVLPTLEDFTMNYLLNTKDDVIGFDDSLKTIKIIDSEGRTLTMAKLRSDTLSGLNMFFSRHR